MLGKMLKGGAKKTSLNSHHRFCLISLTKNMLEGWDIIHWKGGIHSFVWSTKTFLYDIWEPRYKQIKMGYQISKCLNIENFVSGNLILPRFMLSFSSYEYFRRLGPIPF